jgi:phospholipase/carboxylesterase
MRMNTATRPNLVSRRRFGAIASGTVASFVLGGACHGGEPQDAAGRMSVRLRTPASTTAAGARPLGLDDTRDAILAVPAKTQNTPLPLLVLLHGAGGNANGILRRLGGAAADAGLAVLAPASRDQSWDAIGGGFGPDVRFLTRALERVSESVVIDTARISIGGFSDGATYALSLGLLNGDIFRRIVAFSPGFVVGGAPQGKPRIFVSHGTGDRILPINRCSRVVVPALRKRGYEVTYREFDGDHEVPAPIAAEGMSFAAA